MCPTNQSPDSPLEWLNRARSDLGLARAGGAGIYLEDLCFHTQQAVEKSLKALLLAKHVSFPYVHDLALLMSLLENEGQPIPSDILEAAKLTRFAVTTRYPGIAPSVTMDEYEQAVNTADAVVQWTAGLIETLCSP